MKHLLYVWFSLMIMTSCATPDESVFELDLSTVYNQINFKKPVVGQESSYIHFTGSEFGSSSSSIDYTGDTLVVSLIAKSGNNYTFQERITNGSAVYDATTSYIEGHDIVKTSEWQIISDSLVLNGGSTFLYWPGRQALPFSLGDATLTYSLTEWGATNSGAASTIFNIGNGRINAFDYEDIVGAYDVIDTPVDGDGFEILYNRPFGLIRSSRFGAETLDGFGWDLQLGI